MKLEICEDIFEKNLTIEDLDKIINSFCDIPYENIASLFDIKYALQQGDKNNEVRKN